jgi:hypothetical protein
MLAMICTGSVPVTFLRGSTWWFFDTDRLANARFKAELQADFCQLAKNPEVATAPQIVL